MSRYRQSGLKTLVHVAPRHLSEPQTADPSLSRLNVGG
ncbi:MAG: hypothetical protein KME20_16405 [Kaiparowitsia implicata GSE-PSE-MK54-09C]|nr:hypothetical protein [Kaiparowitsia implicata GSE-PSE-MK54-09C]